MVRRVLPGIIPTVGASKLLAEPRGPVTVVTLNRPEVHNCIDAETAGLLAEAIRAFAADGQPGCSWSPAPGAGRSARVRT